MKMTILQQVAARRASIPQKKTDEIAAHQKPGGLRNFVAFLTRAKRGQGDMTRAGDRL
jgi:hypothetical protein